MRHPSKSAALRKLNEMGAPVATIFDVGVLTCTAELIDAYPAARHILIEPVAEWNATIRDIYSSRKINFELLNVAASDSDGQSQLELSTVIPGEPITHARLTGAGKSGPQYRTVETKTLDTLTRDLAPDAPFLLKIDVDGAEMRILSGAGEMLKDCSIVIIEAGLTDLLERAGALDKAGFELFDIVDPCYYDRRLAQVDLVFLNRTVIAKHGLQL